MTAVLRRWPGLLLSPVFLFACASGTAPVNTFEPQGGQGGQGGTAQAGSPGAGGEMAGAAGGGSTPDGGMATVPPKLEEPLKVVATRAGKLIGTAIQPLNFSDPDYKRVAAREFNYVTPENEMKWNNTESTRGEFTFTAGDLVVGFAAENGMKVRGHTLVWYQALPTWVRNLTGDELRKAMLDHVTGVVSHYKGKVHAWDVVNEAIADGPSGALRSDSPFTALGPSHIDDAFVAARAADPDALLFYNDYDGEAAGTQKSDAIFALVKSMKERGVPIDGVGLQMHIDPRRLPLTAKIKENMERIAALGLLVNISEMDVPVGMIRGDEATKFARQAQIYGDIVRVCAQIAKCDAITFWGFTDKHSWLNLQQFAMLRGMGPHYPLPFDANYQVKPAAVAIFESLDKPAP